MPNVSELTVLPITRQAPSTQDYVVGLLGGAKGEQAQSVLVPISLLPSGSSTLTPGSTPISGGSANHILYDNGGTLAEAGLAAGLSITGGNLTATGELFIGSSPISGGTTGRLLYDNGGVVGEAIVGTGLSLSAGTLTATGGGGTPGGTSGQVQYNNAGAFGGMAGTTWDATNQALTIAGATVTTSVPVLNLSQTWNAAGATFTALKLNVTNTASATGSMLMDLQVGGTSYLNFQPSDSANDTRLQIQNPSSGKQARFAALNDLNNGAYFNSYGSTFAVSSLAGLSAFGSDSGIVIFTNAAFTSGGSNDIRLSAGGYDVGATNLLLSHSGYASLTNATSAAALRVYNTVDNITSPTNYERGVFDWTTTANTLTIGTQAGGTGAVRTINFVNGGAANLSLNGTVAYFLPGIQVQGGGSASIGGITFGGASDCVISRVATGVFSLATAYMQWGGQARMTATQSFTSNAVLANLTGLSVNVQAGRTYNFEACIFVASSATAGGVQGAISGTATATSIVYAGWTYDSGATTIHGYAQATALGTQVGLATGTTSTVPTLMIYGSITVNAAGTLTVQAAQGASNATATVIAAGSYFRVFDTP